MKYLILIAVTFFGLQTFTTAQDATRIEVRHGHEKPLDQDGIKIRFLAVTEDSRCPKGVNCVWAGVARVKLEVSKAGGKSCVFEVNTNEKNKPAVFDGLEIRLEKLDPYPSNGRTIDADEYVATFSIQRDPKK